MEVRKCLVLIHLRHTQFFNKQLFDLLQLIYFVVGAVDLLVLLVDEVLIVLPLLILDHALTLELHLEKLALALVYLVPLTPLPEVIILLLLDSTLKQLLLLGDENALGTEHPLLR